MSERFYDNLSFFNTQSEIAYYGQRIRDTARYLEELKRLQQDAIKRQMAQLALERGDDWGDTEQEFLGNV